MGSIERAVTNGDVTLFRECRTAAVVVDGDGRIVYANAAAEALLGTGAQALADLAVGATADAEPALGIARPRDGDPPASYDVRVVRTAGGPLVVARPRDVDAELRAAERTLAERAAELERSNRDLERFAAVVSHDLQEPLRVVKGYVGFLDRRYKDKLDQDGREFIQYAVEASSRMQALIDDLLQYSRVGTRGRPFEPVDAGAALADATANLAVAIREAGATVEAGPLPRVLADRVQVTQLFQNLVGNAIKFRAAEPPVVRVAARRAADLVEIAVSDNGIGIDPKDHARLFVIFQRLHAREDYPGTGIGLALCKRIVERHGGTISIESAKGRGSTFRFTLRPAAGA